MTSGKKMEQIVNSMYVEESASEESFQSQEERISIRTEGKVKIFWIKEQGEFFDIQLEMRKDENNAVENIRRWQLVTNLF